MLGSSHLDVAVVAHGVEVCLDPAVHAEGRGGAVRHQGVGGVGAGQAWGGGVLFLIFPTAPPCPPTFLLPTWGNLSQLRVVLAPSRPRRCPLYTRPPATVDRLIPSPITSTRFWPIRGELAVT